MRVFFLTSMVKEWLEQGKPQFSRHLCMCEAPAHPWRYWAKAVQKMDDLIWSILLSDTSYMWPQRQVHETLIFFQPGELTQTRDLVRKDTTPFMWNTSLPLSEALGEWREEILPLRWKVGAFSVLLRSLPAVEEVRRHVVYVFFAWLKWIVKAKWWPLALLRGIFFFQNFKTVHVLTRHLFVTTWCAGGYYVN